MPDDFRTSGDFANVFSVFVVLEVSGPRLQVFEAFQHDLPNSVFCLILKTRHIRKVCMAIAGAADWSCTPLATVLGDGTHGTSSTRAFGMKDNFWPEPTASKLGILKAFGVIILLLVLSPLPLLPFY